VDVRMERMAISGDCLRGLPAADGLSVGTGSASAGSVNIHTDSGVPPSPPPPSFFA
jgi:hypothetical protein